jgi:hypothetical protein
MRVLRSVNHLGYHGYLSYSRNYTIARIPNLLMLYSIFNGIYLTLVHRTPRENFRDVISRTVIYFA